MVELGAAELAFTREEAAAFLKGVMGLDPSAEDVSKLEGRTEGWIAGLQLAALSMRSARTSRASSVVLGGHRDVLDFLAEEVLERQPETVQFPAEDLHTRKPQRSVVRRSYRTDDGQQRWRGWRGRTSSSSLWTTSGVGTVTTPLRRLPARPSRA